MKEIENREMDDILRQSLVPGFEPDLSLNQQILRQAQGRLGAEDLVAGAVGREDFTAGAGAVEREDFVAGAGAVGREDFAAGTGAVERGDICAGHSVRNILSVGARRNGGGWNHKIGWALKAAVFLLMLAGVSGTVYAAWRLYTAEETARQMHDRKLAGAFRKEAEREDAGQQADRGETQVYGGYQVTLLGVVSGWDISDYPMGSGEDIQTDRTYAVVAIQRVDGSPVSAEEDSFFVSPLIQGYDPVFYNAATMRGAATRFEEEGVLYWLVSCSNVEYFADHRIYLCVTDTDFYNKRLYTYDELDGSISRRKDYDGLNALFELELDASKADPAAAQALLEENWAFTGNGTAAEDGAAGNGTAAEDGAATGDGTAAGNGTAAGDGVEADEAAQEPTAEESAGEVSDFLAELTLYNLEEKCVLLEDTVQTAMPDEEGMVNFTYALPGDNPSIPADSTGGLVSWLFRHPWGDDQHTWSASSGGKLSDLIICIYTLNEDGSVTFGVYVPKDVSRYLE